MQQHPAFYAELVFSKSDRRTSRLECHGDQSAGVPGNLLQHSAPRLSHDHERVESETNACMTRRYFGSQNGMQRCDNRHSHFAQGARMCHRRPPKMPNSCCKQTMSTLLMLRKSAARR